MSSIRFMPVCDDLLYRLNGKTKKEKLGIIYTWIKQGVIDIKLFSEILMKIS